MSERELARRIVEKILALLSAEAFAAITHAEIEAAVDATEQCIREEGNH